jgi:hypothetical protein
VTRRDVERELAALKTERDALKDALYEAVGVLIDLGMVCPHEAEGPCAHCAFVERAVEIGRPLRRYRAEIAAATAVYAREQPERYAELRREWHQSVERGGTPMVRPTALTPALQERICLAIRAGAPPETAAVYAGIGKSTYYAWMKRGERGAGPFVEFREAIKKALAEFEVHTVAIVRQAAPQDWKAAMTLLERRFPDRWGRRDRVDHTHRLEEQVERLVRDKGLDEEQAAKLRDFAAERLKRRGG